ncbi:MAG TPA: hypothetical protein VJU86_18825 [Pyrinomonadaceae bacterium]|nr:hypothetical protein [Pyrinomonadaceae bacterium]
MKRCSQCEFIYEDDQFVCDMDGQALIQDHSFSVLQAQSSALAPIAAPPKSSTLRGIGLPAGVGLLLAALFSVGFYVSDASSADGTSTLQAADRQLDQPVPITQSSAVQMTVSPVPSESAPASSVETPEANALQPGREGDSAKHAHPNERDQRLSIARDLPPLPRVRPLPRLPNAKPLGTQSGNTGIVTTTMRAQPQRSTTEPVPPAKKDSKVGSFLKKTGRVLSKPFKF